MPALTVTLSLEYDGVVLPNSPITRRLEVPELSAIVQEQADHGDATTFAAVQAGHLDEIRALILTTDQEITLRLDGQSDAGIVLRAGGLLALLDVDIDAGAGASNASLNNNSGATATLRGVAGGT